MSLHHKNNHHSHFAAFLPPPTVLTVAILLPLTAFGTVEAILHLKKYFGRTLRKLLTIVNPLVPSKQEIRNLLLQPIPIDEVENHIQEDHQTKPVIRGAERYIQWAAVTPNNGKKKKTPFSVVFFHGWSASRQEGRPVVGRIAQHLEANLYCCRLPGHGRQRQAKEGWSNHHGSRSSPDGEALLQEATPRELFLSALDSLRVGMSLGDRVILIGISTGGALATWLASLLLSNTIIPQDDNKQGEILRDRIAALILISPAYALGHPLYPVLKHTFAALRIIPFFSHVARTRLIRAAVGTHRTIPAMNEDHYRYCILQYSTAALLHLMDVLYELEIVDYASITIPTLMIGNPQDPVVNFRVKATNTFLKFGDAPNKILYCLSRAEHPHIISCDYASPSTVDEITSIICLFLDTNQFVSSEQQQRRKEEQEAEYNKEEGHVRGGGKRYMMEQSIEDAGSGQKGLARSNSALKGLGSYASYPSFGELTRPLEF